LFKKRTSKHRRRREVKTLHAQVISPRIAAYDARKALGHCCRMLAWLGVIGGVAFLVWTGLNRALFQNPEFQLQELVLNDNPVVDEARLFQVTGIETDASLFQLNPTVIRERLLARPEILHAKVTREFPGRLEIVVAPRRPQVWISCPSAGVQPRDPLSGLLVDAHGKMFGCRPGMLAEARMLPVIEVSADGPALVEGEEIRHPSYLRGMRLLRQAQEIDPGAAGWIDVIRQHKSWASEMITRAGTVATFGHDEIDRQMRDFLAALRHSEESGRQLASIQLIGRRNLPVTFQGETPPAPPAAMDQPAPPRAILVDEGASSTDEQATGDATPPVEIPRPRVDTDLQELLER
jgi:hypothetical protein